MEKHGIKVGFLGYSRTYRDQKDYKFTKRRALFTSGPAFYRDDIATRDVKKLKEVFSFELFKNNLTDKSDVFCSIQCNYW